MSAPKGGYEETPVRHVPDISVVIPTRDRLPLLLGAVDTVLAQVGVDFELIVVDDGSSDGTTDAVRALPDSRIRVIRNEMSAGVSRARNAGVSISTAPWIAFLDDDDLWAPEKLSAQLTALSAANAHISFTSAVVIDAERHPRFLIQAPVGESLLSRLLVSNCIGTPSSVVVSREAFDRAEGFDPAFSVLADWDLWLRVVEVYDAAPCHDVLIAYTKHAHNMHVEATLEMVAEFSALRVKHAALSDRLGVEPGDIEWSRWVASSHRRAGRRLRAAAAYFEAGLRYHTTRDFARAAGMLLGERSLGLAARLRPSSPSLDVAEFAWLTEGRCADLAGPLR